MGDAPEAAAGDSAGGPVRRARKTNPLANRIKRLMQTDEDVGKIAQAAPALIGKAMWLAVCATVKRAAMESLKPDQPAGRQRIA